MVLGGCAPVSWRKSGEEETATVQEKWGLVGVQGVPGDLSPRTGQSLQPSGGVVDVQEPQEAAGPVSRGQQGTRPAAKRQSRPCPGPRRAAGSRRQGRVHLQPSHRLLPSPSPSRRVRGPARQARGSSRHRRGGVRRRGSRGCARRAGCRRSAREDSQWGSAHSRPPTSPQCSGPAAAASTRRTAAPLWPQPRRALRMHVLLQKRAPAAAASERTRALGGGGSVVRAAPGTWPPPYLGRSRFPPASGFRSTPSPAAQDSTLGLGSIDLHAEAVRGKSSPRLVP